MDRARGRGRDALTLPRPLRLDGRRPRRPSARAVALVAHLALLGAAGAVLAVAVRGQWFFGDEWAFIVGRDLGEDPLEALLDPHNEHLSAVPVLVYRALLGAFGLHTYWPYIAVVLGLHLLTSHLLWHLLVRAGARLVTATAAATVFALLGSGGENLLWAFQMGFVGSLCAGLGALLLADHDGGARLRDSGAVLLCLVAVACSGVGIAAVATVALAVLLRRGWRAAAALTAVPAALYLAWFAAFGRDAVSAEAARPLPPLGLGAVPRFAFEGLANTAEDATGAGGAGAVLVLALLVLVVRRPQLAAGRTAAVVACAGGAVGFFLLTGVSRVAFGIEQARVSRYVYVGALLLLPLAALGVDALLERVTRPATVVVPLALWLVAVNVAVLYSAADRTRDREQGIRSTVLAAAALVGQDAEVLAGQPDPDFSRDLTVGGLRALADRGWLPQPGPVPPVALATARAQLLVGLRDPERSRGFTLGEGVRAVLEPTADGCTRVRPLGEEPQVLATTGSGRSALLVRPGASGPFSLRLLVDGQTSGARTMALEAGTPQSLVTLTRGSVLLTLPADGTTELCP